MSEEKDNVVSEDIIEALDDNNEANDLNDEDVVVEEIVEDSFNGQEMYDGLLTKFNDLSSKYVSLLNRLDSYIEKGGVISEVREEDNVEDETIDEMPTYEYIEAMLKGGK